MREDKRKKPKKAVAFLMALLVCVVAAAICAVIHAESRFNADAISSKGASGLMQIMEDTAYWLAPKMGLEDFDYETIFDPDVNIRMGSMTNTLVLAYIGSSLSIILLLVVYADSLTELFKRELVIVEILQALVGSLGILLTIPLTALVCSLLYAKKPKPEDYSEDMEIQ